MRDLPRFRLVFLVILGACHSTTAPKSYNAGTWRSAPMPPATGYTQFSLDTVGGVVRGDGQVVGLNAPIDTFTITGVESYPSITLNFAYSSGGTAAYSAQFVSPSQLLGTWAIPGQAPRDSVSYSRQ